MACRPTQSLNMVCRCKVIEDTTGGKITYTNAMKGSPLQYTSNNFTTGQRVDFFVADDAPVGSYFEVAWYVDEIMQGERMIMVVERFPPGGNKTRASIGDITLEWRAWKVNRGENIYNYVWLDKAPQDMGDHILITERVTKNQYTTKIWQRRGQSRGRQRAAPTLPAVFWLSDDVTDGRILCMYSGAGGMVVHEHSYRGGANSRATRSGNLKRRSDGQGPGPIFPISGRSGKRWPLWRTRKCHAALRPVPKRRPTAWSGVVVTDGALAEGGGGTS